MEIDASIYEELINNISIKNVILKDLKVESEELRKNADINISTEHEISSYYREGDALNVLSSFKISGTVEDSTVFFISFSFTLNYSLESKLQFDQQYLEFFTQNNVPVNVWPYARELVSSLTTRMGFPSLILPVLKV